MLYMFLPLAAWQNAQSHYQDHPSQHKPIPPQSDFCSGKQVNQLEGCFGNRPAGQEQTREEEGGIGPIYSSEFSPIFGEYGCYREQDEVVGGVGKVDLFPQQPRQ